MSKPSVICPGCSGTYHEITDLFNQEKVTTGDMLRLKEPYRSYGWSTFAEMSAFSHADLFCPSCEAVYPGHDGKVTLNASAPKFKKAAGPNINDKMDRLLSEYDVVLPVICKYCSRSFKSIKALNGHMAFCKIKKETKNVGEN